MHPTKYNRIRKTSLKLELDYLLDDMADFLNMSQKDLTEYLVRKKRLRPKCTEYGF
jgi:hypothetical protein